MKKMNNKGFSLVELIVVVLIMAIIAVALAPQVMKWVENSRKSTDCNNYDSVVSAVNIALANETVMKDLPAAGTTLTWTQGATTPWSGGYTSLNNAIGVTIGTSWATDMKIKRTTDYTGPYTITIDGNGTVTRTNDPNAESIS
ncbi:MAG: type II secretion system protein [Lachnospiraceae bacterium]|nr:type II secretion system protein [Lachnospiraceae bacterium]